MKLTVLMIIAAVVMTLFVLVISPLVLAILFPAEDEPEGLYEVGDSGEPLS